MEAISCSASRMGALRSASSSASRTCSATLAITSATCKPSRASRMCPTSSCSWHPARSHHFHFCICRETKRTILSKCKTSGSSHRVYCRYAQCALACAQAVTTVAIRATSRSHLSTEGSAGRGGVWSGPGRGRHGRRSHAHARADVLQLAALRLRGGAHRVCLAPMQRLNLRLHLQE